MGFILLVFSVHVIIVLRRKQFMGFRLIALLPLFSIHGFFCLAEKASYYSFVREANSAPPISYYDYIIIGGGTAGCPLAATLSKNASVLLLERGGSPYEDPDRINIDNFAANILDDCPSSLSDQFVSEDGVYNTRARVLGGGSVLNAGFYTRASSEFVRRGGWNEVLVNRSYSWVERKVALWPAVQQWQSAVRDGLLEVGVLPDNGITFDHIYGTKVGGTIFDGNGRRHTAADLLEYADPRRIRVLLHATVHKMLFIPSGGARRPRANGVIFEDELGRKHAALLSKDSRNEIILSAGAIGSPQLLMLSGVGPARELRAHGIKVVVDQPAVGLGMSDNPMNALFVPSPLPVEVSLIQVVGISHADAYIETASGLSFPPWARRFHNEISCLLNLTREDSEMAISTPYGSEELTGGVILEKIMGPISEGHLKLRTANPKDNPQVTFNYFESPEDLRRCVQGMKTIIDVINSKALSKFRYKHMPVQALMNFMVNLPLNLRPKHATSAISLEQFCIDTVMTIWHYHGGCQVGRVVDRDLKVLGVDGLRVVDGSTFYHSPGTNPQATVMMLGRYMGRRILYGRNLQEQD